KTFYALNHGIGYMSNNDNIQGLLRCPEEVLGTESKKAANTLHWDVFWSIHESHISRTFEP
ncbi:MAG TPA: hypothetical protein PLG43_10285, partial [Spirochaetia bacterium]|nr:hypothetical protein [Spirochaetia bacterium]